MPRGLTVGGSANRGVNRGAYRGVYRVSIGGELWRKETKDSPNLIFFIFSLDKRTNRLVYLT